jgi:hypothetical protein
VQGREPDSVGQLRQGGAELERRPTADVGAQRRLVADEAADEQRRRQLLLLGQRVEARQRRAASIQATLLGASIVALTGTSSGHGLRR